MLCTHAKLNVPIGDHTRMTAATNKSRWLRCTRKRVKNWEGRDWRGKERRIFVMALLHRNNKKNNAVMYGPTSRASERCIAVIPYRNN